MAEKETQLKLRGKMDLPVGKRIKGSAFINEFGEFDFRAYQVGATDEDKYRVLKEETTDKRKYTILISDNALSFRLTIKKGERRQNEKAMRELFLKAIIKYLEYDI